ncbi:MAG TPA: hypothetical protein VGD98_00995 [Ktedonobacteraceae bacterium]
MSKQVVFNTKAHLRIDGKDKRMTVVLTGGQHYETTTFEIVIKRRTIKRMGRGGAG